MERTVRRNGRLYYGEMPCDSADEAYRAFKSDYHESLGKRAFRRLDARERKERVHGFRTYLTQESERALDAEFGSPEKPVLPANCTSYILGIAAGSYCRIMSAEKMPDLAEERLYGWLEWLMLHADTAMRTARLKDNSGRNSTNRKRYR